jgi:5'-nucleotidase (lipoprotein e(P4) family)
MQYLYGSGEAAAGSVQAWNALVDRTRDALAARPRRSVVLAEGATLAAPRFEDCGARPPAAVFDVDETVLLNLGAEYDAAIHPGPFDPKRWDLWERTGAARVLAVPGARDALFSLRRMGVTVVFNSNRAAANADQTAAALNGAGLGPAVHGNTLWLKGDAGGGGGKDARRRLIAQRYCVVAMGGDQLGDFSDLFNAGATPGDRRAAAQAPGVAGLWGRGWFVLPNPVYGTALAGSLDEVFPPGARWPDPSAGAN